MSQLSELEAEYRRLEGEASTEPQRFGYSARADFARPADHAAGFLQYQARQNFRDLCRVYGFGGARQIVAEIINDEAERKADD